MGHEQARRLGLRLAGEPVQQLVSSDLMRAQQTATPAAHQLELPIVTTVALREQHFGIVEGMRADEIRRCIRAPGRTGCSSAKTMRCPRANRRASSMRGSSRRWAASRPRTPGRTVLVVTHGGVLDMVWRTAHGLGLSGPRQSDIPNAGFNRIRIADAAQPDAASRSSTGPTRAHLADLPAQPTYDQRRHLKA